MKEITPAFVVEMPSSVSGDGQFHRSFDFVRLRLTSLRMTNKEGAGHVIAQDDKQGRGGSRHRSG